MTIAVPMIAAIINNSTKTVKICPSNTPDSSVMWRLLLYSVRNIVGKITDDPNIAAGSDNMVVARRSNNTFAREILISFNMRLHKNVAIIAKLIFVCFIFFKLFSAWLQSDYGNNRIVLNKSTLMVGKKV